MALGSGRSGAGKKAAREARERARLYQARQEYHDGLSRRRARDNVIAGVAGGALILAIVGGQVAYYTVGPGAPAPAPSPTPAVTPTPTVSESPSPTDSPTPTDSVTPSPTPTPTP